MSTGIKIIKKSYKESTLVEKPPTEKPLDSPNAKIQDYVINNSDDILLSSEQKEDLIDKLETKKHQLKQLSDKQEEYKEVCSLLAKVKECDAIDKIKETSEKSEELDKDFKNRFKKLEVTDFNKIIDLTGSKEGRKPDISTETWIRGKTVVFKNRSYIEPPEDKKDKFSQKMKLKPMPTELKNLLNQKIFSA